MFLERRPTRIVQRLFCLVLNLHYLSIYQKRFMFWAKALDFKRCWVSAHPHQSLIVSLGKVVVILCI